MFLNHDDQLVYYNLSLHGIQTFSKLSININESYLEKDVDSPIKVSLANLDYTYGDDEVIF